jgi:hypothetical protein
VPPLPKFNVLAVVLKEGKVRLAVPVNALTEPQVGVQKLIPVTLVLTDADVGVTLMVPPFRLKSILSASAAVGSASNANKSTRLIFAPPDVSSHCGGYHSLNVGS